MVRTIHEQWEKETNPHKVKDSFFLRELTQRLYDTLMKNEGMSEWHLGFDTSQVDEQLVRVINKDKGEIEFTYEEYKVKIHVSLVPNT